MGSMSKFKERLCMVCVIVLIHQAYTAEKDQPINSGCETGKFGIDCSLECGNCINNTFCNNISGRCPDGCDPGWTGQLCNIECANKTFGLNCSNRCGNNCNSDGRCYKNNGICIGGCTSGYDYNHDKTCNTACSTGFFGQNCTHRCHCSNNDSLNACGTTDGSCPKGCEEGWTGRNCSVLKISYQESGDSVVVVAISISASTATVVVLATVVGGCIYCKRKDRQSTTADTESVGAPSASTSNSDDYITNIGIARTVNT
ncbi:protein draper-like isoform X1 [Dreissena polymorpha]|uniref:protein draper-like isoform X1 n=1 Tax=Dreissena polymorpha TaxID=45954 RepID=UPI0022641641|nr:protein draper-like isoform X1 [Dreissena polymorpha]